MMHCPRFLNLHGFSSIVRRKVFEQVCLLKAKNNISEEENGYARLPLYHAVSNEGHCCRGGFL